MARKRAIVIGTAVVVGSLAAGGVALAGWRVVRDSSSERDSEAKYTEAHRADVRVSQADAERAATAARPGQVSNTHLESEGQGLRWEVKTDDGHQVWEVQVDANSGQVVSDQPDE